MSDLEASKVGRVEERETDPRALASMASFGLLLSESEVCLLADFTCDLLTLLDKLAAAYTKFYSEHHQDGLHELLNCEREVRAALSTEAALKRPTPECICYWPISGEPRHRSDCPAGCPPPESSQEADLREWRENRAG